jgi:DNA polymerase V
MSDEIRLDISSVDLDSELQIPFEEAGIKAGFPSPAQDYMSGSIDLNRELVRHKETTFYARVSGNSLIDAGISDGDIIVVDKSLEATTGDYVVAFIDGEFTLKEFRLDEANRCAWLVPYNKAFSPIKVTAENDFMVWGVVTYVIKKMSKHF